MEIALKETPLIKHLAMDITGLIFIKPLEFFNVILVVKSAYVGAFLYFISIMVFSEIIIPELKDLFKCYTFLTYF